MPVVIPANPVRTRYTIATDWEIPGTTILHGETRRFKVMFLYGGFAAAEASAFWLATLSESIPPRIEEYFAQPDEIHLATSGFTCVVGRLPPICEYMHRCYPVPHTMDAYTYWLEQHYFHVACRLVEP